MISTVRACHENSLTIVVRSTGEATLNRLLLQIERQKNNNDILILLDENVCFEKKLKLGYEKALEIDNEFTVFIDADILLRRYVLKKIRKIIVTLPDNSLGFGLRLWDKFYNRPKYRGLHIYKTELLSKAISFIPLETKELRPESFVKEQMNSLGFKWRNGVTEYIAGIHDYNQNLKDIYYKFLIRAKRSSNDIEELKKNFASHKDLDFKIALKGLVDSEKIKDIYNDKFKYNLHDVSVVNPSKTKINNVDFFVFKKIINRYGYGKMFWNSLR